MAEVAAAINTTYKYSNTRMLSLRKPNVFQYLPSFEKRRQRLQLHTHVGTHVDILHNSINLLYPYKFGICIYQKYQYDISQLCMPRCCVQY